MRSFEKLLEHHIQPFSRFLLGNKGLYVLLGIVFLVSRLMHGLSFETRYLLVSMQYLDPIYLKYNLLESIWYLHSQPPLFNLFLGIVLKLSPLKDLHLTFLVIYTFMGLMMTFFLFSILRHLNIRDSIAFLLVIIFMTFDHTTLMFERWLFYTYPLAVLMTASAFFLILFAKKKSPIYFFIFSTLLAVIVLTRAFYHIIWMLMLLAIVIFPQHRRRKQLILISLGPFIICFLIYLKNFFLIGQFSSSSYLGHNMITMTRFMDREKEIKPLVSAGKVSELALLGRFAHPTELSKYVKVEKTGVHVLDDYYKTTNKNHINFNCILYAKSSPQLFNDCLTLIIHYPMQYLKSVANSIYIFCHFQPYLLFDIYPNPPWPQKKNTRNIAMALVGSPLITMVFIIFSMIAFLWMAIKTGRANTGSRALQPLYFFLFFNIIYTFAVSSLLEILEACFYRYPIDPFILIGIALGVEWFFKLREQPTGNPDKPENQEYQETIAERSR